MTAMSLLRNLYRVMESGGSAEHDAIEFIVNRLPKVASTTRLCLHHIMALSVTMEALDRGRCRRRMPS
jgi:hypothetical protein